MEEGRVERKRDMQVKEEKRLYKKSGNTKGVKTITSEKAEQRRGRGSVFYWLSEIPTLFLNHIVLGQ